MSVEDVICEARKDDDYYGTDGGLTLSGGEPLFQPYFSLELLKSACRESWKTAIETSGFASWEVIEHLMPFVDLLLYDLKCADPEKHFHLTGRSNKCILDNLRHLDACGGRIELRCPLIPGKNDSDRDLQEIMQIAEKLRNITGIRPEPYHPFGADKLLHLGRRKRVERIPNQEDLRRYEKFFHGTTL